MFLNTGMTKEVFSDYGKTIIIIETKVGERTFNYYGYIPKRVLEKKLLAIFYVNYKDGSQVATLVIPYGAKTGINPDVYQSKVRNIF